MEENTIKALMQNFTKGVVTNILIRDRREAQATKLEQVLAIAGKGLEGDHYNNKGGTRQITLIQAEHLKVVCSLLNKDVLPEMLRRNLVVGGINLISLKGKKFKVGNAILEYSGECHPCSRMEKNLGKGGYNAMRGHGGITAKVIVAGEIKIGDSVTVLE